MDAEGLGQQLRAAREARELTLEEIEQATRIRARFLEAFETGAYEGLPGVVQARGFLRNYARFLKLDAESILVQYDAIQAASAGRGFRLGRRGSGSRPAAVAASSERGPVEVERLLAGTEGGPGRRIGLVLGAILGAVVIGVLCLGAVVLVEGLLNQQVEQGGPDLVSLLPTLPSATPSATFVPSATPPPDAVAAAAGPPITDRVVLVVNVVQRSWARFTADGVVQYEGIVTPGAVLQYQADQVLVVEASNGSGLDVVFNNQPIGLLGLRGEAIVTTFTPDLVLTPTPDLPPTATITPVPPPTEPVTLEAGQPTPLPAPGTDGGGLDSGADPGLPLDSGASEGQGAPTPLPVPGVPSATPDFAQPTLPGPTQPVSQPPAVSPTLTVTLSPSPTPSATVTEPPSTTPTPTAILPPRLTSTPIPVKQG